MRKSINGFSLLFYGYGAPLGGLWPPEFRYETPFSVNQPFPSVNNDDEILLQILIVS